MSSPAECGIPNREGSGPHRPTRSFEIESNAARRMYFQGRSSPNWLRRRPERGMAVNDPGA